MLARKIYSVLLLLAIASAVTAQDFTMTFVFTDAQDNRDSVVTGAAEDATLWFDSQYDGPSLIDTPRHEGLDVRLWTYAPVMGDAYSSKRNIIPYESILVLEVSTNNWPVQVIWESTEDTEDSRVANSVFTENEPAFWGGAEGDVAGLNYTSLNIGDDKPGSGQATFNRNFSRFADANGDTVFVYWIAFLEDNPNATINREASPAQLSIFPNPTADETINLTGGLLPKLKSAALYNSQGQEVRRFATVPDRLRIGTLPPGFYVFRFHDNDGQQWTKRFLRR